MSEKICKTCAYSIFCPSWGEYKCEMKQHRINVNSTKDTCDHYKKNTSKNDERKCHCSTCVAEGYVDYED